MELSLKQPWRAEKQANSVLLIVHLRGYKSCFHAALLTYCSALSVLLTSMNIKVRSGPTKEQSRLFSYHVPQWWNNLPSSVLQKEDTAFPRGPVLLFLLSIQYRTHLSPPRSSPLLSPVYIRLHSLSIALNCWLIVALVQASLGLWSTIFLHGGLIISLTKVTLKKMEKQKRSRS